MYHCLLSFPLGPASHKHRAGATELTIGQGEDTLSGADAEANLPGSDLSRQGVKRQGAGFQDIEVGRTGRAFPTSRK